MKWWALLTCLFTGLAGVSRAETVTLDVTFKLTDQDYQPLAGKTARIAFSGQDWRSPDAGQRVVTDAQGMAHLTATVELDKQSKSQNIGMTPFSWPVSTDHLLIAVELERVLPLDGKDQSFHWLYTENVFRYPTGETSGGYVDDIFTKDASGRFTRRLEPNLSVFHMADRKDPEDRAIGGDEGYVPTDFGLERDDSDPTHPHWTLSLAFKAMPPPVWR
jgi:hypothetical protein